MTTVSLDPGLLILPEENTSLDCWPSEFTGIPWLNTSSCKRQSGSREREVSHMTVRDGGHSPGKAVLFRVA